MIKLKDLLKESSNETTIANTYSQLLITLLGKKKPIFAISDWRMNWINQINLIQMTLKIWYNSYTIIKVSIL